MMTRAGSWSGSSIGFRIGGDLAAAQIMLLYEYGMDVPAIAKVAFTSEDLVQDVIRIFSADGFNATYPKYKGWYPPKFTLAQRWEIEKLARSKPVEHDLMGADDHEVRLHLEHVRRASLRMWRPLALTSD
jgi:hypothetical protein